MTDSPVNSTVASGTSTAVLSSSPSVLLGTTDCNNTSNQAISSDKSATTQIVDTHDIECAEPGMESLPPPTESSSSYTHQEQTDSDNNKKDDLEYSDDTEIHDLYERFHVGTDNRNIYSPNLF